MFNFQLRIRIFPAFFFKKLRKKHLTNRCKSVNIIKLSQDRRTLKIKQYKKRTEACEGITLDILLKIVSKHLKNAFK